MRAAREKAWTALQEALDDLAGLCIHALRADVRPRDLLRGEDRGRRCHAIVRVVRRWVKYKAAVKEGRDGRAI